MKVLVCGGRDYRDHLTAYRLLDALNVLEDITCIVHGGASGADELAGKWASRNKIECRVYPADWQTYGKSAGPRRNQSMLDREKPDVVCAFPGGRGTADMVGRAKTAGVKVFDVAAMLGEQP